jgi:hypothetical protein
MRDSLVSAFIIISWLSILNAETRSLGDAE